MTNLLGRPKELGQNSRGPAPGGRAGSHGSMGPTPTRHAGPLLKPPARRRSVSEFMGRSQWLVLILLAAGFTLVGCGEEKAPLTLDQRVLTESAPGL